MKALLFRLTLLEPTLMMDAGGGDPNSAVSLDYLPGSALRGALVARYLAGDKVDAGDPDFRSLFFNPQVRFLHAYPVDSQGGRSLPRPLSLVENKDEAGDENRTIYDRVWIHPEHEHPELSASTWKAPEKYAYVQWWQDNEQLELIEVGEELRIHIARVDRRKTISGSSVFRYRSLAAGQTFIAPLLSRESSLLERFKELLPAGSTLLMGKSLGAGYGRVRVESCSLQGDWQEAPSPDAEVSPDSLVITLLSDALLRHPLTGEYTSDLGALLGVQPRQAFLRSRVVGGFNRAWNLPLPQAPALQAGSVFVFPYSQKLGEQLAELQQSGIGERTIEGYGRLMVGLQISGELGVYSSEKIEDFRDEPLQGEAAELAHLMTLRIARARLDGHLRAKVNSLQIHKPPQKAQLSRLRQAVRLAQQANKTRLVLDHLDNLKRTAKKQLEGAKVGDVKLEGWIRDLVNDPSRVWSQLEVVSQPPVLGGIRADQAALANEYTLRLIDGVLAKARKEETS